MAIGTGVHDMTVDMWIGFGLGALVSFFISSVFAGVKFHELHNELLSERRWAKKYHDEVMHLEQQVHPRAWTSDPQHNIKVKARLYDEHEDLIKPGEEVIRIEEEGDMPDMPAGWRERVGDSDE